MESNKCDKCEIIHKLIQTTRLHRTIIERFATSLDLHSSGHRMLMHLIHFEKIPSQKELAEHFKISPAAVATTLKKLEADGYIERSKCRDIRFNEISITERGRAAAIESEKYFRLVDITALEDFSQEELDLFVRLLEKMQTNLKKAELNFDSDNEKTYGKDKKQ